MKKIINLVLLLAISFAAEAKNLIVLVDKNCPVCRELHSLDREIKSLAESAGWKYIYAPIPNDADIENAWAEKTYYACLKDANCDESQLLKSFYDSQDFNSLDTYSDVEMWLDMKHPNLQMHSFLQSASEHTDSLNRMFRLAAQVQLNQFPTFAIVDSQTPYQIAASGTLATKVNEVKKFLQEKKRND